MSSVRCKDVCKTFQQGEDVITGLDHVSIDVEAGGVIAFTDAPGATLEVAPASAQFPDGESSAIGLSLLPVGET